MKSKKPKVSVIIPAYNREKTLARCLSSVLHQDYEDYEVRKIPVSDMSLRILKA
jgi:cellulose synthase/poly-beta-1,6-N-acetylglucosamine synthase-like glycosyltransferase